MREHVLEYQARSDNYGTMLLASLANTLTEAFVEEVHLRVHQEWWGYAPDESFTPEDLFKGKYPGIRPAFGYPASPDHEDKRLAFELLEVAKRYGLTLTGSTMMIPEASACFSPAPLPIISALAQQATSN
jgi:5-methyltetrahydrofolate--homocysteine methyltransferase